jgi:hypothetical protein
MDAINFDIINPDITKQNIDNTKFYINDTNIDLEKYEKINKTIKGIKEIKFTINEVKSLENIFNNKKINYRYRKIAYDWAKEHFKNTIQTDENLKDSTIEPTPTDTPPVNYHYELNKDKINKHNAVNNNIKDVQETLRVNKGNNYNVITKEEQGNLEKLISEKLKSDSQTSIGNNSDNDFPTIRQHLDFKNIDREITSVSKKDVPVPYGKIENIRDSLENNSFNLTKNQLDELRAKFNAVDREFQHIDREITSVQNKDVDHSKIENIRNSLKNNSFRLAKNQLDELKAKLNPVDLHLKEMGTNGKVHEQNTENTNTNTDSNTINKPDYGPLNYGPGNYE